MNGVDADEATDIGSDGFYVVAHRNKHQLGTFTKISQESDGSVVEFDIARCLSIRRDNRRLGTELP